MNNTSVCKAERASLAWLWKASSERLQDHTLMSRQTQLSAHTGVLTHVMGLLSYYLHPTFHHLLSTFHHN